LKQYRLTPDARRDVRGIWAHIAEDNPAAADRLVRKFAERFEMLGRNPGAGRARDDVQPGLRSFPVDEYVIFYRIISAGVRIMRVLHGRRDLGAILH
jgi:toxin ParE1/3/4